MATLKHYSLNIDDSEETLQFVNFLGVQIGSAMIDFLAFFKIQEFYKNRAPLKLGDASLLEARSTYDFIFRHFWRSHLATIRCIFDMTVNNSGRETISLFHLVNILSSLSEDDIKKQILRVFNFYYQFHTGHEYTENPNPEHLISPRPNIFLSEPDLVAQGKLMALESICQPFEFAMAVSSIDNIIPMLRDAINKDKNTIKHEEKDQKTWIGDLLEKINKTTSHNDKSAALLPGRYPIEVRDVVNSLELAGKIYDRYRLLLATPFGHSVIPNFREQAEKYLSFE